jgi:O-antigen/teichoic acid export membrane protein
MSATKRFGFHLIATLSQGVFGVATLLFVIPQLTNVELGYVAALESLTYLFATVAGFNLDRAASRFYFNKSSGSYRQDLLRTINLTVLASVILCILLVYAFKELLSTIFPEIPFWPFISLALIRVSLEICTRTELGYLIASGRSARYAAATVLSGVVGVCLSVFWVNYLQMGVLGWLYAQLVAVASLCAFTLGVSGVQLRGGRFNVKILTAAVSYSWPFIPNLIGAWVISYFDRILVNQTLGLESLGLYALATKMASVYLLISASVTKSIYPTFYAVYAPDLENNGQLDDALRFSKAVIYIFALLVLFTLTIGGIAFKLIFGERVEHMGGLFGYILLMHWVASVAFLSSESMMRANATVANMILGLLLALLSLGLNYWLIQAWGTVGAVASGIFVSLVGFCAQMYLARRLLPVPFDYKVYGYVFTVLAACVCVLAWNDDWQIKLGILATGLLMLGFGVKDAVVFLRRNG